MSKKNPNQRIGEYRAVEDVVTSDRVLRPAGTRFYAKRGAVSRQLAEGTVERVRRLPR